MKFCTRVKQVLRTKLREMAAYSWLFVQNPGRDFTRERKLSFETTLQCLITMEGGSLQKELLSLFQYDLHTPNGIRLGSAKGEDIAGGIGIPFSRFQ